MYILENDHFKLLRQGEKLFLEAWFNLTHERSLDSFRVRCHNGRTILEELKRESAFEIASTEDIAIMTEEARDICNADPIIKSVLATSWQTLIALIDALAVKKPDQDSARERKHLDYILADVLPQLPGHYLTETIRALEAAIVANQETEIVRLVNGLATEMASRGNALSGMHIWVRHFLSGVWDDEQFVKNFAAFAERLQLAPRHYDVTLLISGNRELQKLGDFGGFKFSGSPPDIKPELVEDLPYLGKFLRKNSLRTFASTSVDAVDRFSAVNKAQEKFAACLDRLRFNFSRQPVITWRTMMVTRPDDDKVKIVQVESRIPSPEHHLPLAEFLLANKKVDDLIKSNQIPNESRQRLEAAVRHYRLGMDGQTYQDKLLNWWMGLETLTNAGDGKGIGARVVKNSLVLITHRYFEVQLNFLFKVTGEACEAWTPRVLEILGNPVPRNVNMEDRIAVLQDSKAQNEISAALHEHPWVQSRWRRFVELVNDPQKHLQYLKEHDQRVRWHLLRLYRIRCCLIHGTPVQVPLQLPSANLEYYLREATYVTIEALLQARHVSSLEAVFDRAAFGAGIRREILARKGADKSAILQALSTGIIFKAAK